MTWHDLVAFETNFTAAELVRELENSKPVRDTFHFGSLESGLERAGRYIVDYTLSPSRPALGALSASLTVNIKAGEAIEMAVQVSQVRSSTLVLATLVKPCAEALAFNTKCRGRAEQQWQQQT